MNERMNVIMLYTSHFMFWTKKKLVWVSCGGRGGGGDARRVLVAHGLYLNHYKSRWIYSSQKMPCKSIKSDFLDKIEATIICIKLLYNK